MAMFSDVIIGRHLCQALCCTIASSVNITVWFIFLELTSGPLEITKSLLCIIHVFPIVQT